MVSGQNLHSKDLTPISPIETESPMVCRGFSLNHLGGIDGGGDFQIVSDRLRAEQRLNYIISTAAKL
jgi:hypothetical protein